ncbi:hypothetical protein MMC25_001511 [Agyrium rufum]|nr:hypothetical protein [Agyrium rufum]
MEKIIRTQISALPESLEDRTLDDFILDMRKVDLHVRYVPYLQAHAAGVSWKHNTLLKVVIDAWFLGKVYQGLTEREESARSAWSAAMDLACSRLRLEKKTITCAIKYVGEKAKGCPPNSTYWGISDEIIREYPGSIDGMIEGERFGELAVRLHEDLKDLPYVMDIDDIAIEIALRSIITILGESYFTNIHFKADEPYAWVVHPRFTAVYVLRRSLRNPQVKYLVSRRVVARSIHMVDMYKKLGQDEEGRFIQELLFEPVCEATPMPRSKSSKCDADRALCGRYIEEVDDRAQSSKEKRKMEADQVQQSEHHDMDFDKVAKQMAKYSFSSNQPSRLYLFAFEFRATEVGKFLLVQGLELES